MAESLLERIGIRRSASPAVLWRRGDAVLRRLVAAGLLAATGLLWATVIGVLPVGDTPFLDAPLPVQVKTAAFSVVYAVAAVGMWLLSAWGMVAWLAAIGAELAVTALFADVVGIDALAILAQLTAAAAVLSVAFMARRYRHLERA